MVVVVDCGVVGVVVVVVVAAALSVTGHRTSLLFGRVNMCSQVLGHVGVIVSSRHGTYLVYRRVGCV